MFKELIFGFFYLSVIICESNFSNVDPNGIESFILNYQNKIFPIKFGSLNLNGLKNSVNMSQECFMALKNLTNFNVSPVRKYIDALPKPQGVLLGNIQWLGSYDECSSIEGAKYCLSQMHFPLSPSPGEAGICVPKQCTTKDIGIILNIISRVTQKVVTFTPPIICDSPIEYKSGAIITIILCGLLLLLTLFGTLLESIISPMVKHTVSVSSDKVLLVNETEDNASSSKNPIMQFFNCFSLIKNIPVILSTETKKDAIESLNGIRVISLTWVILGHMFFIPIQSQLFDNPLMLLKTVHNFSFMAVGNAYVAVDSFFMLSGFLVTYLSLRRMDSNNGKLPLLQFYIHRYIRLTPVYGFVILLWNNLFPLTVTGPNGAKIRYGDGFQNPCNKYWWSNLLYINNFYPDSFMNQCLGWSWYLANDMQYYIISPAILYALYWLEKRYGKRYLLSFLFMGAITSISLLSTGLIIGINNYPNVITAFYLPNNPRISKAPMFQSKIYEKPYTRFGPYAMGMLLGYIISRNISVKQKRAKKIFFNVGWLLFIATGLAVVYGIWSVFKPDGHFLNNGENVIFGTFHRVAWACAVAWVVYACHNNAGGLINKFLSWKFWIPLSRLSFNAYLIHLVVVIYFYNIQENGAHYQASTMAFNFVSVSVISYACAFVLAVCVEYPVFNLESLVFK